MLLLFQSKRNHFSLEFCPRPPNVYLFCSQGEVDETAIDVNLSGSLAFDSIVLRYIPSYYHQMPLKLGVLNGETKLSGSLLRP